MASSKSSPGPHDRRVDPTTGLLPPKPKCIKITKLGKRCTRDAIGRSRLCKSHKEQADAQAALEAEQASQAKSKQPPRSDFEHASPTAAGIVRGGQSSAAKREHKRQLARNLGKFVVNEQARVALAKLGNPAARTATDPRQTLLDTVASAWRQQQVWEQMLAAVPEDDWQYVGMIPVPGSTLSAKGARIESIQKYLGEATKSAARISKLAIDAGIEERLVRLAEEQSALIADTVKAGILAAMASVMREVRLSQAQHDRVLDEALGSAATHLRLLAAGLPGGSSDELDPRATATTVEGEFAEVTTRRAG